MPTTSCKKSCHKDACRHKLEVSSEGLAINIFLTYIAKLLSDFEHLINVLQNERNNCKYIWKCGKYRKIEVGVVGTRNRVSNLEDKLMYASASLTYYQSTLYGANSATFFSDLNLCKCLKSSTCLQYTNLKPSGFQLFGSIPLQRRKRMESHINTICFS